MKAEYIIERQDKLRGSLLSQDVGYFLVSNPVNCRYLSGFTGGSVYLVIAPGETFLFTDFRYRERAYLEALHCRLVFPSEPLPVALGSFIQEMGITRLGFEQNYLTVERFEDLHSRLPGVELVPLSGMVEGLRAVKGPGEIETLQQAAQLTESCFARVLPLIKPGVPERDIALELEFLLRREGGEKASFDYIVASGARSSQPHGVASEKLIQDGDLVVIDFGVCYQGYCSDMTRTVAVGKAGRWERELYRLVRRAQGEALARLQAGLTAVEADALAREVMKGAGLEKEFGHGLGHGVGLEVHEEPRLSPMSRAVLQEGMVVTVEPGAYIPGRGGVRIEDMVVIRDGGCQLLTGRYRDQLMVL